MERYESTKKAGSLAFLQAQIQMEFDNGNALEARPAIEALFQRKELLLHKKTKRGETDLDLIPMLRRFQFTAASAQELTADVLVCAQNPALNPQLLISAIAHYLPDQAPSFAKIHRVEIFDQENAVFR